MARPGGYFRVPVRQAPPKRRRAVRVPRPEVSVQSKPQARRTAPVHTDLRHPLKPLLFQPTLGKPQLVETRVPTGKGKPVQVRNPRTGKTQTVRSTVPTGSRTEVRLQFAAGKTPAQQQAAKNVRLAATKLPAEHQIPRFPVLRHYSEPQRQFIVQHTTAALQKVARQRGIPGHQVAKVVYETGDKHTRQTLRTFGRVVRERRQIVDAKALDALARQNPGVAGSLKELGPLSTAQKARAYRAISAVAPSEARPGPKPPGLLAKAAGAYVNVVRSGGPGLFVASKAGEKTSEHFHEQLEASGVPDAVAGNLLRDAVDLPAQAIPSAIYAVNHPAAAAKGFVNSDPLALALQGRLKEAREAARQHPGIAALEVVSAGRAADSFAGFVDRGFRRDPGVRTTQQVPGTNIVAEVPNPKGLIAGKAARRSDARARQRVDAWRQQARDEARKGNFDEARNLRDLAAREDPGRLPEQEIRRRVDEFQPQAEMRRRQDAADVDSKLPEFKEKGEETATQVTVQGIAKADRGDINALIGELEGQAEHGNLTRPQLAANRELRTRLEQYAAGEVEPGVIQAKAQQYAAVVNPISQRLIERGMLSTDSAKYVPYAVGRGFRHSAERLRTPEYIAHLDAKIAAGRATKAEVRIRRQYEAARRKTIKQQYLAEQAVIRAAKAQIPPGLGRLGNLSKKALLNEQRRPTPERVEPGYVRNDVENLVPGEKVLGGERGVFDQGPRIVADVEEVTGPGGVPGVKVTWEGDWQPTTFRAGERVHRWDDNRLASHNDLPEGDFDLELARKGDPLASRKAKEQVKRERIRAQVDAIPAPPPRAAGPALLRFEKVRANEALLERQLKQAQANAAAARKVASESKPPKGQRYRPAGFAPPEVAPRLERMNQLREEARSHREQQREAAARGDVAAAQQHRHAAIYREKVANAIREEVERNPSPRLTGPELVDAVTDYMVKEGYDPADIAFVTQAPGLSSAGAYFVDWSNRRGIGGPHRTGEATLKGTFETREGILRENARRLQSLLSADENFTAFIGEFALRGGDGKLATFKTAGEARDAARKMMYDAEGNELAGAYEWSVVRTNPWLGRREQLQALLDDVNAEGLVQGVSDSKGGNAVIESIQDALSTDALPAGAEGEFALVPKVASGRLLEHTKILGPSDGLKVLRFLNSAFRRTVLATSVPWITGNVVEGLLRAGIERAGPGSLKRMNAVLDVLERIDPAARAELDRRAFGGGQAHLAQAGHIYTAADQFRHSNKALQQMARAAATLRRTPGVKQLGDWWKSYTDWVFHSANHGIEARIQKAIGGRYVFPEFGTVSKAAIEDAARGLTNTTNQVALARAVQRAYGKYDAFSPTGRQFIMLYTPFVAWSLNSLRFLGDVLPKDHPALTAALAAAYTASKDWREDQGMSYFVNGALPGFLQGSYPTSKGPRRVSRYTPFGIASDLPGNWASLVMPQYHGALSALEGLDWKGQRLRNDDGTSINDPLKLMLIASREFAYSSVPVANQINRFIAGGGDPKALWDIINPLKPVSNSGGGGSSSDSGGWSWSGSGGGGSSGSSSSGGGWSW